MLLETNGFQFVEVSSEAEAQEAISWLRENGAVEVVERDRTLAPTEKSFGVLTAAKLILGSRNNVRVALRRLFPEIVENEIVEAEKIKDQSIVTVACHSDELINFLHYSRDQLLNKTPGTSLCVFIVTTSSAANLPMPPDLRSVLGMTIKVK
jgi:hypothetical protein